MKDFLKEFLMAWLEVIVSFLGLAAMLLTVSGFAILTFWHPYFGGTVDFLAVTLLCSWFKVFLDEQ